MMSALVGWGLPDAGEHGAAWIYERFNLKLKAWHSDEREPGAEEMWDTRISTFLKPTDMRPVRKTIARSLFMLVAIFSFVQNANADVIRSVIDYIDRSQIASIKSHNYDSQNAALVTAGIQAAFDDGVGYMPAGTYRTNGTLIAQNVNVKGDGMFQTYVIGDIVSATVPVLAACRSTQVRDLNIQFATTRITGTETEGQRVGIVTGAEGYYMLQRGGGIYNVRIEHVGTAISDLAENDYGPFSVTFDTIEIENPSFRGIDFRSYQRTGNCYRNIYIHGGDGFGTENSPYMNNQDCGFYLSGQESESSIDQINVEWGHWRRAFVFDGLSAASIGTLHIEEVTLRDHNSALIDWNHSTGRIQSLSVIYCPIITSGWSAINVMDATYVHHGNGSYTNSLLSIGTFNTAGLNDGKKVSSGHGISSLADFYFVIRNSRALGNFSMRVDNKNWNTFQRDTAVYSAWPKDPHSRIRWR